MKEDQSLLERGDQLECERQRQITLDREAELMRVESELGQLAVT